MAIAEALTAYGPMRRSVLLLWVSGEEKGLLGSKAWTLDPTLPEGMRAVCNLNIDMIGRNPSDYLLITPTRQHPAYNGLTRMAERHAPLEGFPRLGGCDEYWRRSDHMNFSDQLGVPVAFLFSDVHEDYHQPSDTWDKIDFDKIRRVSRLVVRMLDALQGMDLSSL
jgi:Zn-dependent M28 family amino/carboxypeptidase